MGFFGVGIYDSDIALDVKDDYINMYRKGVDEAEIIRTLIKTILIEEEAYAFWFALADIQMKNNSLDNQVKDKALSFIDSNEAVEYWRNYYPNDLPKRIAVLRKLKEALLTYQPHAKKISRKQPSYHCKWKIGDTYAYPLLSDYAKEKGLYGEYFIIYKIGEVYQENYTFPVTWIKITKNGILPTTAQELNDLKFVQVSVFNYNDLFRTIEGKGLTLKELEDIKSLRDEFGLLPEYRIKFFNTSSRCIPKCLQYIGNYPNITPPKKEYVPRHTVHISAEFFKFFEKAMINKYFAFTLRQAPIYSKRV